MLPGRKKNPRKDEGLGRSRGGLSSKIHCVVNDKGIPVDIYLSGGQVHDSKYGEMLLEGKRSKFVVGDRAYASAKIRRKITSIGAESVIPLHQRSKNKNRYYDRELYKRRNVIERFFCRLKQFRAIATRYCKRGQYFLAAFKFVTSIITLLN